jgi:hypothetical protein
MIPATRNGLPSMACVSAMQKCIRRSMEREAMEFAVELMHTSKAFHSMICNRLIVICHEDLDTLAAPWVVPFVATAVAQSKERYSSKIGEARLMVGNASRGFWLLTSPVIGAASILRLVLPWVSACRSFGRVRTMISQISILTSGNTTASTGPTRPISPCA